MKKSIWIIWITITLAIVGYYGNTMLLAENKEAVLIGEATYGHYQIEMACTSCHTDAFGGEEVIQDACVSCHQEELKDAHDSHPKKKFNDPRNADTLEILDARYCISCHTEHQAERTHPMGVTIPEDYCFHCHQDVGDNRPSHEGLAYDSCASAGCHNYHDNKALYENFLVEHANQPWLKESPPTEDANWAKMHAHKLLAKKPSSHTDLAGLKQAISPAEEHWDQHKHLAAGVACISCHQDQTPDSTNWLEKPGLEQCQSCHVKEAEGYLDGRHGMRLSEKLEQPLTALSPKLSRTLEFSAKSMDSVHGCTSCHSAHEFNLEVAATQACLGCHQDQHSLAFEQSKHAGLADEQGEALMTCATCHMPRIEEEHQGQMFTRVEHNQSRFLRPNEKMIRPVCMGCHSLEFSIDALADEALIQNNFTGQPSQHIQSIDWALERVEPE